ncbi:hypothetical protein ACFL4S_00520 [bacterium]
MFRAIAKELEHHAPFTFFGALTGIIFLVFFKNLPDNTTHNIFYFLHPMHVVMSALVTASMYKKYKCNNVNKMCNLGTLLFVGYVGSLGIATLSDSIIPYLGELLLGMPNTSAHIGFIEKWWLVNPLAILGICIAYFKPMTKVPHSIHVFISTWASTAHIMMALNNSVSLVTYLVIFLFLFSAVWIPCCTSDIVFPLLFVKNKWQTVI